MKAVRIPLALMMLAATTPAFPCAPTPEALAAAWANAYTACDFSAAWNLLSPSDRRASGDREAWTVTEAADAIETFACYDQVGAVEVEASGNAAEVIARFVVSRPAAVEEFNLLRQRRDRASWRDQTELNSVIERMRARLAETRPWHPRITYTFTMRLQHDVALEQWCAFLDLERERVTAQVRTEELSGRRAAEAVQREEAQRRAMAARDKVNIVDVRRGESTLGLTGVFGEVVNSSAEPLRVVRVVFEFLDSAGSVVEERSWTPIFSGTSTTSSSQPLPPGQRRRFGMRAEDVTAAWSGRVRARVTEVEIAGLPAAGPQ
jgi:hypothetical protein